MPTRSHPAAPHPDGAARGYPEGVFRRSPTDTPSVSDHETTAVAAGSKDAPPKKGKPTRKRREAEAARKMTFIERATRGSRPSRAELYARREAMRRGDESVLPARDRGPVRRFVRDYVDARRNLGSLFIPVGLPLIVLVNIPSFLIRALATLLLYALLLAIIVDSMLLGFLVRREVQKRFPNESVRGVALYAVTRAMQFRRMRIPAPRVTRGTKL